jgi:hypothetical protein
MDQTDSSFFIPKEFFGPALQSIFAIMTEESSGGLQQIQDFRWVSGDEVLRSKTLSNALKAWRWRARLDKDDNIVDVHFTGEKSGDDYILFNAIAPYVRDGSYISMRGEDHYLWRWFFDEGVMHIQEGMIVWR